MTALTIIIQTYNRLTLLKKAVESCFAQEDLEFETIIIDNHSEDGTTEYLNELSGKHPGMKIVINEKNMGPRFSGITAMRMSNTPWVTFLCDDDWIAPGFTKSMNEAIRRTDSSLIICGFRTVDEAGRIKATERPSMGRLDRNGIVSEGLIKGRLKTAGVSGFAFKLDGVDPERINADYPRGFFADTRMVLLFGLENGVEIIKEPLYARMVWSGSESGFSLQNVLLMLEAMFMFQRDAMDLLKEHRIDEGLIRAYKRRPWFMPFLKAFVAPIARKASIDSLFLRKIRDLSAGGNEKYAVAFTLLRPLLGKASLNFRRRILAKKGVGDPAA